MSTAATISSASLAHEGRHVVEGGLVVVAQGGGAGIEIDRLDECPGVLGHMQRFEIRDAGAQGIEDAVECVFRAAAVLRRLFCRLDAFVERRLADMDIGRNFRELVVDFLCPPRFVARFVEMVEEFAEIAFLGLLHVGGDVVEFGLAVGGSAGAERDQ